jgi:hypothetical protein
MYSASRKRVGGIPGTTFSGFIEKVGGRAGKGQGKGLVGMGGSCFAGFRMARARWNGQLKTKGDPSKI